jgi:hypothetical protein
MSQAVRDPVVADGAEGVDRQSLREHVRSTLTRLSRTGELPALPAAGTAALAIARDPDAGVESLCQVIRADVGLSARILRRGSAAYARRARGPRRGRPALGLRRCDLLVAAGARSSTGASPRRAPLEPRWRRRWWRVARATGPAICVVFLRVFSPGRIAFLLSDDMAFGVVDAHVDGKATGRPDAERSWYGFDHAEAGAILAEDWGLVHEQVEAIRWHHQPGQADQGRLLAAVLNVADAGAYAMGFGGGTVAPADVQGRELLGLTPTALAEAVTRARGVFVEHHDLFA